MRNPWSAKATRTSVVEPLNMPKREITIPIDVESQVGIPTTSTVMACTTIASPLGQPDAQAFSTPGTLVEHEHGQISISPRPGENAAPESVAIQRPPSNGVIYVGSPFECPNTVIPAPRTPSSTEQPRRSRSAISNRSITSAYDICRICHCEGSSETPLISPCSCSGSLKYVHQKCLQQWIKSSQTRSCEVCRFTFIMETKIKPFRKWEKLDITAVERRKILCSVSFHIVAITCVMWSLYVLIDRTAEEIRAGNLDWPFWTKLVVVAIGFTGGLVFMYVQCKMYVQLFRRWQSYNKVIYVQNGPAGGGNNNTGGDSVGSGKYVQNTQADGGNGSALNK